MMQAMTAIFLLRCLKVKKYYVVPDSGGSTTVLSETELFLARLLHHFMRVTYYNTHEITTASVDDDQDDMMSSANGGGGVSPEKLRLRRIGRATNPTLALLNHSCDPNYRCRAELYHSITLYCHHSLSVSGEFLLVVSLWALLPRRSSKERR